MRIFCLAVFCVALLMRVVAYATAEAVDPVYIGVWQVTGVAPAPWLKSKRQPRASERAHLVGKVRQPRASERARLVGKVVVFKPTLIAGPAPFTCKGPRYRLRDLAPDTLFDGAFAALRAQDKSLDPAKLAAQLGFAGDTVPTLETGCAFKVYFADAATAHVGLDGFVYTLKKQ